MKLRVQCYSGHKADERPVRFELGGRDYLVEEVLDRWHGPDHSFFKVRADDGNLYILRQNTHMPPQSSDEDEWTLVSYRQAGR